MPALSPRPWVPAHAEAHVQALASAAEARTPAALAARIETLIVKNRLIHERDCFNLDPAANVMNPRAEAALCAGLSSRPSLGYPGAKYETGLEAIEEIEVITAELAARVFRARFVETRVPSGAMANLYAFMALARPGDAIIVPPAAIAGHATHHRMGCAGLYGLQIHEAPPDSDTYSVDLDALRQLARLVRPKVITLGGSLNLLPHPVSEVRAIADEVGATVLVDAAHQCGPIAGEAWPDPLAEGAHLMSMSTYKSLGGPAGGLLVTNDENIARRLDAIAFPGMTANADAGRTAALALTLTDWLEHGRDYAAAMIEAAAALAAALAAESLPVFATTHGFTRSHQLALAASRWGGGGAAARHLRKAGFLASGIGLPLPEVEGDTNGLRLGTSELVRWGMKDDDMPTLARLLAAALLTERPENLASEIMEFRARFRTLHFVNT